MCGVVNVRWVWWISFFTHGGYLVWWMSGVIDFLFYTSCGGCLVWWLSVWWMSYNQEFEMSTFANKLNGWDQNLSLCWSYLCAKRPNKRGIHSLTIGPISVTKWCFQHSFQFWLLKRLTTLTTLTTLIEGSYCIELKTRTDAMRPTGRLTRIREARLFWNGWIFWKFPRGGGGGLFSI